MGFNDFKDDILIFPKKEILLNGQRKVVIILIQYKGLEIDIHC